MRPNESNISKKKRKNPLPECDNCDILMADFETLNQTLGNPKVETPHNFENAPGLKEIGKAGWTILHTFAAYYPESPSTSDQFHALAFVGTFAELFPCKHCATEFKEIIEEVF
jgi:hypothetical protein